jgi:hypothetical protein
MMFLEPEESRGIVHQDVGIEHKYFFCGAGIGEYYG